MHFGIFEHRPGLSAYIGEILHAWGLRCAQSIASSEIHSLSPAECPVLIVPAGVTMGDCVQFAERGGHVICFIPPPDVERIMGLERIAELSGPLALRVTDLPVPGLAGETLPVVGKINQWKAESPHVLAYLTAPDEYALHSPAIVQASFGNGRITAFCFDLPRCVLMLRQGDPQRQEQIPKNDTCIRASHLACQLGSTTSGWIPFADLLGKLLLQLVVNALPFPAPLLDVLPDGSSGLILFSGDEDGASIEERDNQLKDVLERSARMTLYIIPNHTHSTRANLHPWQDTMDFGPHPNVRPLDGAPVADRVDSYQAQIAQFSGLFGPPHTVRNHCLTWAGYTECAEVEAAAGIRMDANYLAGATYGRHRLHTPFGGFGGAIPLRFCRQDGHLIDLYQQMTHVEDDVEFGNAEYSAHLSPAQFTPLLTRLLDDQTQRFHLPLGFNFHPSNWSKFSRQQGIAVLDEALSRRIPVCSFDQWQSFWSARDTWKCGEIAWQEGVLRMHWRGESSGNRLRLLVPMCCANAPLVSASINGRNAEWTVVTRSGERVAQLSLAGTDSETVLRYDFDHRRSPSFR